MQEAASEPDVRSLNPLDLETVRASVRNTGRVVIAPEVAGTGGFGVEAAVLAAEHAFFDLDGPVRRVADPGARLPYGQSLAGAVGPSATGIAATLCTAAG